MQDLDHIRPPTPPHHPTAGVRILQEEIDNIAKHGFPNHELISLTQAPPGKSYNNRIYFLRLRHAAGEERPEQDVVLKVNGRFFGPNKIQNEVSCFRLLQKHCPNVPAPRALAWSEDGRVATFATPFMTGSCHLDMPVGLGELGHGGWVLMTRLPGSPLADADLDDGTMLDLADQLGDIVACWRQNIPFQKHCGNIRMPGGGSDGEEGPLNIQGALHIGINAADPITNINEYYRTKLGKSLSQLESSDTYASSRYLIEPVRAFTRDVLPGLDLTDGKGMTPGEYIFTHYDLSPRNLLISGQPPRITGIVDFEFGGFFPAVEEFLNDLISNEGDFPCVFYNNYLERLEKNGVATPATSFDPAIWNRNYWLETLATRIAPWDLPGDYQGGELEEQLRKTESDVKDMLQKLSSPQSFRESPIQYG